MVEKVPVVKNKVVKKGVVPAAPVAQNSTHEVVPKTVIEEKEVTSVNKVTGEIKKEIKKVPVVKNEIVPKKEAVVPKADESDSDVDIDDTDSDDEIVAKIEHKTGKKLTNK